jgi:hypothetical protein
MFGEASALFQCAVAESATRSCIVQQNVLLFQGIVFLVTPVLPKNLPKSQEKLLNFFLVRSSMVLAGRSTGRSPTEENEGSEDKDEESGK